MNISKKSSRNRALLSLLVVLSVILTTLCPVLTVNAADRGEWAPNTAYTAGDTVSYNGVGYTCIQSHTSLSGWEPSNVPALWKAGGEVVPTVATPAFNPPGGTYSTAQNVAITCTTSGATIRYTTDGSEPTSSSAVYTGAITVSSTATIKAKAFRSGMNDSSTATAAYTIDSSRVAMPVLSPAGGNYSTAQNVTITCATSGADIRYTADGSEPSASSALYTGAIPVTSGTVTIKAKAFKSGMTGSATASATYTISTIPSTGLPAHLLTGYWHNFDNNSRLLRISDVPTTYDIIAVAFAEATTVKGAVSFALDPGLTSRLGYTEQNFISDIAAAKARGQKVIISVGGERGFVSVSDATAATNFANSVYSLMNKYGFDGVDIDLENGINATYMASALRQLSAKAGSGLIITMAPQTIDMQNTGMGYFQLALNIKDILTICNTQYYNSGSMLGYDGKVYYQGTVDFLTALATIQLENGLRPDQIGLGLPATSSAAGGGFVQPSVVNAALDCLATGAAAGNYKPPRTYPAIRGAMTWSINWDAANGYNFANTVAPKLDSLPNSGTTQVAAPTFNPAGGTYAAAQNVTISCATGGASIRYTTDGSEPTLSSAVYAGAITVSSTATIKAKAFKSGTNDSSSTAAAAYTITSTPPPPPAAGYSYLTAMANQSIVCADNYGNDPLIADRISAGDWELFQIINNSDGTISLLSKANGKYVCADLNQGAKLVARSSVIDAWEKFQKVTQADGTVALKAMANNQYVCCDLNLGAVLYANRAAVGGAWEFFTIVSGSAN